MSTQVAVVKRWLGVGVRVALAALIIMAITLPAAMGTSSSPGDVGLSVQFLPDGLLISGTPGTGESPPGRAISLGMRLLRHGRVGSLGSMPKAFDLTVADGRTTYHREGLAEWFVNRPDGLEHGFTLAARPPGQGEVVLEMGLSGNLEARLNAAGTAVQFARPGELTPVLTYGALEVFDAAGHHLAARFTLAGDRLAISFDDTGASYPVTVDPLLQSSTWSKESNLTGAAMGWSVARAGDVNGDGYDDVIVGLPYCSNGQQSEGRAMVYFGSASGLSANPNWQDESDVKAGTFGRYVGPAGDVNGDGYDDIIVGASRKVHVYLGSPTGPGVTPAWTESVATDCHVELRAAGDVNGDGYDDIVLGDVAMATPFQGRLRLFGGSPGGLAVTPAWTYTLSKLTLSFGAAGDVNGDGYDDIIFGGHAAKGSTSPCVQAFYGSPGGLSANPSWTAVAPSGAVRFGTALAAAGDVNGDGYDDVIVGAPNTDVYTKSFGHAYVYHGSASGPATSASWTGKGTQEMPGYTASGYPNTSDAYGLTVAGAGDLNDDGYADVIVAAPYYDRNAANDGRAYVYYGSMNGVLVAPAWATEGLQAHERLGWSLGTAGSVNGDRFDDIIIGAPGYGSGQAGEGRALVWLYDGPWYVNVSVVTILTPPNAPTSLAGAALMNSVWLTWQDRSSNEAGFKVERREGAGNWTVVANLMMDSTTHSDGGCVPGSTYHYRVKAYNSLGENQSPEIQVTIPPESGRIPIGDLAPVPVPSAPSGLIGSGSARGLLLTWTDNSSDETGFTLSRRQGDGSYYHVATLNAGVTSYTDALTQLPAYYCYRVAAFNRTGMSAYSNEIMVTFSSAGEQQSFFAQAMTDVEFGRYLEERFEVAELAADPESEPGTEPGHSPEADFSTASDWARDELQEAHALGLTTDRLLSDYQTPITREEFCETVVLLYEALSGCEAEPVSPNPFTDTDNPNILKAFGLGITNGISETEFGPRNLITRQEISVMIYRALGKALPESVAETPETPRFADEDLIASWAIKQARFCYAHEIMKGVGTAAGGAIIDPRGNTTREQAMVLLKRTYDSFMTP